MPGEFLEAEGALGEEVGFGGDVEGFVEEGFVLDLFGGHGGSFGGGVLL